MTCCEVESQNPKTHSSVPRCNHFPSLSHVNIIPQKPLQNKTRLLLVTISSQTDSDWCLQSKQSKKKMANCHKHTAVETYTSMLKEMLFAGQSSCCTCFMLMKRSESSIVFSAKSLCAVKRYRLRRPESLLQ